MFVSARTTLLDQGPAHQSSWLRRIASISRRGAQALRSDRARPLRFALTGGLAALVQLVLLHVGIGLGEDPFLANLGAFLISAQANFWGSQLFTWGDRCANQGACYALGERWLKFHAAISGTALLNMTVFAIARTTLPTLPAAALGIGVAASLNFLLGDRLVFRLPAGRPQATIAHRPRLRSAFVGALGRAHRAFGWTSLSAVQSPATATPSHVPAGSPRRSPPSLEGEATTGRSAVAPPAPASRSAARLGLWLSLALLLALALALRLYGIGFGLPQLYYWDEPAVVNRAIRFGSGDLNPHFFYYPAFYMYFLSIVSGLYFVVQLFTGHLSGVEAFAAEYFLNPTGVYLVSRVTTAVIGTACVLAIFYVGRCYFNALVGTLAALFLAVSALHATQSHIAVTDIPHSLFILLALLPIYRIMEARDPGWRAYALAGLLIGLGTATKYFAILLVPSLLAAHYLSRTRPFGFAQDWPRIIGCWFSARLILAGVATAIGFFIGSPFNVLDFRGFMADYQNQLLFSGVGQGSLSSWFVLTVLPASLGWPIYLLSLGGIVLIAVQHKRVYIPLLLFPAIYFLMNSRAGVGFARYMIPVELFLCLFAAFAAAWIWSTILRHTARRYVLLLRIGMAAGLAAIVVWPLYSTLRWDAAMALETDPRTAAVEWMERNAPPGTVVAIQSVHGKTSLNAPIMTDLKLEKIAQDIPRGRRFEPVRERVLAALQTRAVYEEVPFVYDFDALVSAGVRYILISDENWPEVELGISPPDSPEMLFKQALNARAVLVGCFGRSGGLLSDVPRDMIYPVIPPTIYIYQTDRAIPSDDATQVAHCGAS